VIYYTFEHTQHILTLKLKRRIRRVRNFCLLLLYNDYLLPNLQSLNVPGLLVLYTVVFKYIHRNVSRGLLIYFLNLNELLAANRGNEIFCCQKFNIEVCQQVCAEGVIAILKYLYKIL